VEPRSPFRHPLLDRKLVSRAIAPRMFFTDEEVEELKSPPMWPPRAWPGSGARFAGHNIATANLLHEFLAAHHG